jgi:hypothetical protein
MQTHLYRFVGLLLVVGCGSRTDLDKLASFTTVTGSGGEAGAGTGAGGAGMGSGTGGNGVGGNGASSTGGAGIGGSSAGGTGGAGGSTPPSDAGACFAPVQAAPTSYDLYFLIDKSASMGTVDPPHNLTESRFALVERAVPQFVVDAGNRFRFGMGFAPQMLTGPPPILLCDAVDYTRPSLIIGTVTGASATMAFAAQLIGYEDPTATALEGALTYTAKWAVSGGPDGSIPARIPPAVVLVTDGGPTTCGSTTELAAARASEAFKGQPRIATYVLGIGASGSNALQNVAVAGGTHRVLYATPSNTEPEATLHRIRRSRELCNIPLDKPLLGSPDVARLQVRTSVRGEAGLVPSQKVANADSCASAGGWYLEPPSAPTMIVVCPSTCAGVIDALPQGQGQIVAGLTCSTAPP